MINPGHLSDAGGGLLPANVASNLLDEVSDGLTFFDRELRFLYVNGPGARHFGMLASSLIGRLICDALPHLMGSPFERVLRRAVREGVPIEATYPSVVRPDRFLEIRMHPTAEGIACYVLDVTTRDHAIATLNATAERLRLIIDTAPVFISYVDTEFRFQVVSQHYVEIFKRSREELIGKTVREVLGDEVWQMIAPKYQRAMAGELMTFETEARYGLLGRRCMHATYTPDVDSSGKVRGVMTVVRDITESRMAQQQLKDLDRKKDEFLATLAHELRNPLAPLSNALQILSLVGNDPSRVVQLRGIMERQVEQLRRLIDDLLDVSRVSRGKIELKIESTDIASVLEQAIESVGPIIEAHRHELVCKIPSETLRLRGDPGRLVQVFGNLIHNAAKYTLSHGRIRIIVERKSGGITVRVCDTGIGIPEEMLASIFEPFIQVNQSPARSQNGLGIGLTLVKTLVEMHGGTVEARSAGSGQGSEFIVWLPADEVEASRPTKPGIKLEDIASRFPRFRIMVVDDVKESGDTLAMLLGQLGQDVLTVRDGFEALGAIDDFAPHVVFSDIGMPRMDGYTFAKEVQRRGSKMPLLIALTGYGQKHDRQIALESGFHLHLVKPVSAEALENVLTTAEDTLDCFHRAEMR